jgi:uncharacterized protein (DUF1684 family)
VNIKRLFVSSLAVLLVFCGYTPTQAEPDPAYRQSIEEWRAARVAALKSPDGYLNLVNLYWLRPGTTSFGAAQDNEIIIAGAGVAYLGEFVLGDDGVTMIVKDGAGVTVDGELVGSIAMHADTSDEMVTARLGTLAWNVVLREGRYALRLRDLDNPAVEALPPIPHFDVSEHWRVNARMRFYDQPLVIQAGTVIEGLGWNPESPGVAEFEIDGSEYSLEAYDSGELLFFVFGDQTSGRETYPAGRFLYSERPGPDGRLVLDFNSAYNPPCAFNDFSTCPVATPRNRLKVRVTAGEKYDDSLHYTAPTPLLPAQR